MPDCLFHRHTDIFLYFLCPRSRDNLLKFDPFFYERNKKGCTYRGAAEQKARSTYEYLIDLTDDPAVLAPLRFLREREIVHFQRFGEALEIARDHLNQQHYFFMQKYGCDTK
ncbi:manganese catalase family protein [Anaerotignum sp.]